MQVISPDPAFSPCWVMGEMSPTMYWRLPAASFTTFPSARTSNEGYANGEGESASARPVWPDDWALAVPFSGTALTGAETLGSKICAQVIAVAGSCRMVLHGTVMVMPFSVMVPPQRIGSTPGHIEPSSSVADWMKPSMSNCALGE